MSSNTNYILIMDNGTKYIIPIEEILHVRAVRIYSVFYLRGEQRQYISSRNLGDIYQQLDPKKFFRIHKSHIVNLQEIKAYQFARGGKVTLSDNTEVNVSQRRKPELMRYLQAINLNENRNRYKE